MTYREHIKKTALLAFPVCLGQFGHVMVGVVDSLMVGNFGGNSSEIGKLSLAAASLSNSLYSVFLVFGIGLAYACTPLIANADGENDKNKIAVILRHSNFVCAVSGIVLFLILSMASSFLTNFDQPPEVVKLAIPYFNIMVFSLIPLMFFLSLKQFAEGLSFTKVAMIISLGANLVNVLLNYVFIYGKLGLPALGLNGAGWASFISRVLMAVVMLFYIRNSNKYKQYISGLKVFDISWKYIRQLLSIGIPVGLQFVFEVGAFAFAAIMMGWLGANQMAAHQVAISIASVTYMIASGISSAATVRVGNQLGRRNISEIRRAGFSAFYIGLIFMLFSSIVFILFNQKLPVLFNNNIEVVEIASSLIIIAALFQLSDGTQVIGLGALRGMSDVKYPTAITIISYWVIALPMAYLLGIYFEMGAKGIWYGLFLGLTIAAILVFIRFNNKSKIIM